jgi:hypothetical protein
MGDDMNRSSGLSRRPAFAGLGAGGLGLALGRRVPGAAAQEAATAAHPLVGTCSWITARPI